jgi:hypothetical protein
MTISGPPLLFEARDDAAALSRARASMSDKNIEERDVACNCAEIAIVAAGAQISRLLQKSPSEGGGSTAAVTQSS